MHVKNTLTTSSVVMNATKRPFPPGEYKFRTSIKDEWPEWLTTTPNTHNGWYDCHYETAAPDEVATENLVEV
ncbi:hypothetical protein E1B28_009469 [Marasmius oreades]|uniref:Uncharacterized protein n=1 Tax=Marasmius oreades TaxID=181124 RepID=A0A9P7USN1_9AGAR|nr:uncharacterized protein E1B28_009469 [Marasmius oreades]KAG7090349.1 hypothetical protein E1B28_009469 [Marasmius oreades]